MEPQEVCVNMAVNLAVSLCFKRLASFCPVVHPMVINYFNCVGCYDVVMCLCVFLCAHAQVCVCVRAI